jgi:CRISPR-associated endonuclease/helicase Cas3
MGGSADNDLTLGPEEPAILVGTQDLLVSRALNRGYARSPFRWPIDFALLNNDTQWVFDEVQLLGDALATSTQLAGFRNRFGSFGEVPCVWMSATFDTDWLRTVDFQEPVRAFALGDEDTKDEIVRTRLSASKRIACAPQECRLPAGCAKFVREQHAEGSLTLVIANTVPRAREIWSELQDLKPILLHSRFRAADRNRQIERLRGIRSGIIVSTQVIEAGIDIDADLMITDLAPWSSLVQRFGRVNRYGQKADARIFWVDRPLRAKRKSWADAPELKAKELEEVSAPYEVEAVMRSEELLKSLTSASPNDLPHVQSSPPYEFVLRKADLLDLFDTTPDLTGNFIDVSRFVRSGKELDVYIAWREWDLKGEPASRRLTDAELCPVSIGKELEDLIKKHKGWTWVAARSGGWEEVDSKQVFPGMRILLHSKAGGYDTESGWQPESKAAVVEIFGEEARESEEESHDEDQRSAGVKQTIAEHTAEVAGALGKILDGLNGIDIAPYREDLETATWKHDWGKAHPVFQQTLHKLESEPKEAPAELLAKQTPGLSAGRHKRKFFRHELASALAMLQVGDSDLAAYVAAAHHGKVRVNIRSMPGEAQDNKTAVRVARGVREDDFLFEIDMENGWRAARQQLTLAPTELGLSEDGDVTWSERVLTLLEREGPFRLAYLEMLVRAADERASANASEVK